MPNTYTPMPDRYRPTDATGMRAAALELQRRGLTPQDIGEALRLTPPAVVALIGEGNRRGR
jgi:hypothetical protein